MQDFYRPSFSDFFRDSFRNFVKMRFSGISRIHQGTRSETPARIRYAIPPKFRSSRNLFRDS